MTHDPDCTVCAMVAASDRSSVIWEDENWIATTMLDVPGWLLVMTRRHVDGVWSLNAAEASSFGPILRDLAQATKAATGAERTHLAAQGERALHFHYMILARTADGTPVFDSHEISRRAALDADAPRARAFEAGLREALRETALEPTAG
ncbi:HIT family protein [Novosphingobium sp. BL-52-GroH]|uniref:HIT family protein n=1 Tax=Novosphingobium sp. BL-52-GroH TaxID=3349877 RepID=UPI00384BF7B9